MLRRHGRAMGCLFWGCGDQIGLFGFRGEVREHGQTAIGSGLEPSGYRTRTYLAHGFSVGKWRAQRIARLKSELGIISVSHITYTILVTFSPHITRLIWIHMSVIQHIKHNRLVCMTGPLWGKSSTMQKVYDSSFRHQEENLEEALHLALLDNKVDFVKLILNPVGIDISVDLKRFLTIERLVQLYNGVSETTHSTLSTSTVYWCIASKLKVPLFFLWHEQNVLCVALSLFNQSYSGVITTTKKPTGYWRYYQDVGCLAAMGLAMEPGVHTMSDELILQISCNIFLAFKLILMMRWGQNRSHHTTAKPSVHVWNHDLVWWQNKIDTQKIFPLDYDYEL